MARDSLDLFYQIWHRKNWSHCEHTQRICRKIGIDFIFVECLARDIVFSSLNSLDLFFCSNI